MNLSISSLNSKEPQDDQLKNTVGSNSANNEDNRNRKVLLQSNNMHHDRVQNKTPTNNNKRKRRRTTVVCLNCKKRKIKCDRQKPACGNCLKSNAAQFCFYAHPEWAIDNQIECFDEERDDNSNLYKSKSPEENDMTTKSSPSKRSSLSETSPRVHSTANLAGASSGTFHNGSSSTNQEKFMQEKFEIICEKLNILSQEIQSLKNKHNNTDIGDPFNSISNSESDPYTGSSDPNHNNANLLNFRYNDIIDFHDFYDSYESKRSTDIDFKPLTTTSMCSKDVYISLIFKYYMARKWYIELLEKPHANATSNSNKNNTQDDRYTETCNLDGSSNANSSQDKNMLDKKLPHSMVETMLLNNDKPSLEEKALLKEFSKQRDKRFSTFNILGNYCNNHLDLNTTNYLKSEIIELLPRKSVIVYYLDIFWKYVYPHLPILDKNEFTDEIDKILVWDEEKKGNSGGDGDGDYNGSTEDNRKVIHLKTKETFDLARVAILLLVLRFAFISISTQLKMSSKDKKYITQNAISVDSVYLANKCLSRFKIFRKTKIILLQALLLLKYYTLFSPEDGDGVDFTQGVIVNTTIAQMAYTMGLNRDPSNFSYFENKDERKMYLSRKLWWHLVSMNRRHSIISGNTSIFLNCLVDTDVQIPAPPPSNDSELLENTFCKLTDSSEYIEELLASMIALVNRVRDVPKVSSILKIMNDVQYYLDYYNFNIEDLKIIPRCDKKQEKENGGSEINEEQIVVSLINCKILELQLLFRSCKLLLYHSIFLHYESIKKEDHAKASEFLLKCLEELVACCNLSHDYLSGKYEKYILYKFNFQLNRLVQVIVERCCYMFSSVSLRCCCAIDLKNETEANNNIYVNTFELCLKIFNEMGSILFNKIGVKYFQGYKSLLTLRFILKFLSYYPPNATFNVMFQFLLGLYGHKNFRNTNTVLTNGAVMLSEKFNELVINWNFHSIRQKNKFFKNTIADTTVCLKVLKLLENSIPLQNRLYEYKNNNGNDNIAFGNLENSNSDNGNGNGNNDARNNTHRDKMKPFSKNTEHQSKNTFNNSDDFDDSLPNILSSDKMVSELIPGLIDDFPFDDLKLLEEFGKFDSQALDLDSLVDLEEFKKLFEENNDKTNI
ncbi:uncharacterized protein SCODWIG_01563 [Saccharomycodes ludwigii]|uniref:Zn(2)-C6 fungal-type domain-containing protein n=1 Tax=Saccharomycodes ludwigii TaxID=36035 RepID=A0A376B597_9ASCO|nr:uncharacterized protein SCODWIG_01563 [Saccharomycodes ludwigii]